MQTGFRTVFCVTAAALLLFAASAAEAQSRVGVFDPQRVSEETVGGKRAQQSLESLRDTKQQELTAMEQQVTELQGQLESQGLSLSASKRTELEMGIQRKVLELQTSKELATRELQLEIAAAEADFNEKLSLAVQQFGRSESFAVIFDANTVAWSAASVDVTTAIIDLFDKLHPSAGE
ncbi:MAG: OmpH family outer membrane protein [bacterium]|nr:OmpH family outer membrane protein [bacterium]